MSGSLKRITPLPRLLSLADILMPPGAHPLAQSLAGLLRRDDITCVDVVSYRTDFEALRELGVLHPRESTRILLVPPSGITQSDVKKLVDRQVAGQELRQVDLSRVAELVHLKLIILRKADGREFAVTGSANYTKAGTGNNCEFSVLFELQPDYSCRLQRNA